MNPTAFHWRDGERRIVFGAGAGDHAWDGADVLTTGRAQAGIPENLLSSAASVRLVPDGQVPDLAARLLDEVRGERLVAWGGGRVIDTAKAIASARGGQVCAVPTTLSGAEMTTGHRPAPGFEGSPRVRPALVLADPELMASAAEPSLRASAMNALAHAAEALYVPGRNPVATLAALRAAALLADGLAELPDGGAEPLALGSVLAGYALDSTGMGLHHVLCQSIVRVCDTPHATTNAIMLPHTVDVMTRLAPGELEPLAAVLGVSPPELGGRVAMLAGGGGRLSELGVGREQLAGVAESAAARDELAGLPDPPSREQLLRMLETAW